MNSIIWNNIIRFIVLLAVQVLILQGIDSGWLVSDYVQLFIYPLFILLLPHDTPKWAVLLLAFFMGISVDVFYTSYGVHASAAVMTGFTRSFILTLQAPRGGYPKGQSPTRYRLGTGAYFRYMATAMFIHIVWYHTMECFTIAYWDKILMRTLVSYPASMVLILLQALIFRTKN